MTTARPLIGERYHLFGIAGRGMAPLAVTARHLGASITGCDRSSRIQEAVTELRSAGLDYDETHSVGHLEAGVTVVATPLAAADEPEMRAARAAGDVWHRADLMNRVLQCRPGAGVTGSHGKGTVTALAAAAMESAGLDPLAIMGVTVPAFGGMTRLGSGPTVAEVDDSDLSLRRVGTDVAVVVNLDDDHPDQGTRLKEAVDGVGEFVSRARRHVVIGPSPRAERLAAYARADVWCYGRDFSGREVAVAQGETRVKLRAPDGTHVDAVVRLLGPRTAVNAALALATAVALGADPEAAAAGLATVRTIDRRLEPLGDRDGVHVFDDFGGKHPVTMRGGLDALRRHFPDSRITAVFEPYGPYLSRFGRRSARALGRADRVLVAPPVYLADYDAGPKVDDGWVDACAVGVERAVDRADAVDRAMAGTRAGDVVVFFAQSGTGHEMPARALRGDVR